jgi:hypothetical protein
MARALAILTVLAALCACSGVDGDPPPYAWGIDGVTYWEGVSAVELSAIEDKGLRHRNGHNQGNTGAQGSCGSLASSSVWCRLKTEDKGVWVYTHSGTSGWANTGMLSGENSLLNQGVDVVNSPSASAADIEVKEVPSLGLDFSLTCTDFDLQSISTPDGQRTIEICMHWKLNVAERYPGESTTRYNVRHYRTGVIALGAVLGFKASACGGAMTMSLIADSFGYPGYCQQQKDLIGYFQPWYGAQPYSYNSSVPAGL